MENKSIKVNFLMNAFLTMSSFIFPLLTFPYISRVLLPEGTGKISFANSFIQYFILFAGLGIPTYGVRACAKVRDDKEKLSRTVHELLSINLIMCVAAYIILFVILEFVDQFHGDRELYLVYSILIFLNAVGMEWLYKSLELYSYITIRSIIFKLISVILMFLLVKSEDDYVIYGMISVLSSGGSYLCNFYNARKYISWKPQQHYHLKRHMKAIFTFFAMSCATTIYTNLDTVMLGFMKTDADVGYYNASIKIKSVLLSLVTSLGTVLLPRTSYYVEHNLTEKLYDICKKSFNFVFLIALPVCMYFTIFARNAILFISGSEYMNSVVPMQILMPTVLIIGITNVLGLQILVPLGREKQVLYSEVIGAFTDIVINLALIPGYGAAGAAIGTLAAEIMVLIYQLFVLRDMAGMIFKETQYVKIISATVLSSAGAICVLTMNLNNLLTLPLSAILFFFIYFTALMIFKEKLCMSFYKQFLSKMQNMKK